MKRLAALAVVLAPVAAEGCPASAKCLGPGEGLRGGSAGKWLRIEPTPPLFVTGDTLPEGVPLVTGTAYLGLPAPADGWVYFRAEDGIYRADFRTRVVLEKVSP